jgi:hypothetical protein
LSILESSRHELCIVHGFTLMTPSLHGWKVFPMPGALIHMRITWPSHHRRRKSQVSLRGSFCAHGVLGIPYEEVCNIHSHQTESMPSSTIFLIGTPILELPFSMARHCVYLRARPPQCIFKFGIVPKVSILGGSLATLDLSSKDPTCIGPTYFGPIYFGIHFGCPSLGASPVRLH